MTDPGSENIFGALVLTLSDAMLQATRNEAPGNIASAALTLVGHVPGISIHDLSLGLDLSHPGTVRLVDRMVADDLVARERSDTDGRAVALHLTPAGRDRERLILCARRTVLRDALSHLSAGDYRDLARISGQLVTALLKGEAHALRMCRLCDSGACSDCPVDAKLDALSAEDTRV